MLLSTRAHHPYSFYTNLRVVVFAAALLAAWRFVYYLRYGSLGYTILGCVASLALAAVFRPVAQIKMNRAEWQSYDDVAVYVCAAIMGLLAFLWLGSTSPSHTHSNYERARDGKAIKYNSLVQKTLLAGTAVATLLM